MPSQGLLMRPRPYLVITGPEASSDIWIDFDICLWTCLIAVTLPYDLGSWLELSVISGSALPRSCGTEPWLVRLLPCWWWDTLASCFVFLWRRSSGLLEPSAEHQGTWSLITQGLVLTEVPDLPTALATTQTQAPKWASFHPARLHCSLACARWGGLTPSLSPQALMPRPFPVYCPCPGSMSSETAH